MIPILYDSNETNFNHLGLGPLSDAVSCLVTEERNGIFELKMTYPVDGYLFSELRADRIIKADAGHKLKGQRFKIIRITKPMKGMVTVYAEHVSYLAQDLPLLPEVTYSGDATAALNTWKNSIVDDHPFTVYSDITTEGSGTWSIKDVHNARQALGGVRGSILDTYGGEFEFDNYDIRLYRQRGKDTGALIAYGRNLIDLTQEEEIESTYTSVYPYAVIQDEENQTETVLTLPEYFIDSEHVSNYARRKIKVVDFSEEGVETVEELRRRTIKYIESNNIGVPKVNLKIKYTDLAKTLDYEDVNVIEEVNVCDTVTVYFEKFGIQKKAKVIKTVYDVLLERHDSIEVGEARASLTKSISEPINEKIDSVTKRVSVVQRAANGKNRIFHGPDEPENGEKNDIWYRPVDSGGVEMYIHDGITWSLQDFSADNLKGTINAAEVNLINLNASNITTGSLLAELIRSGILSSIDGSTQINLDDGTFTFAGGKLNYDGQDLRTNGRILFEDGGAVVAWISGQKLHIRSVNITDNAIIGNHMIEKHENGTAFRWVGDD